MKDFWILLTLVVGIIVFVGWGTIALTKKECEVYGEKTGWETDFRLVGGCFAKTPSNGWLKTSNIHITNP